MSFIDPSEHAGHLEFSSTMWLLLQSILAVFQIVMGSNQVIECASTACTGIIVMAVEFEYLPDQLRSG